jgi:hypothetical protein
VTVGISISVAREVGKPLFKADPVNFSIDLFEKKQEQVTGT